MSASALVWDGCANVRDLGGHPTGDGGETVFGAVVRADSVRKLSSAGWAALVGYGVQTIVDLRFHEELAADPPADLPVGVVHVPVLAEPGSSEWDEINALAERAPDHVASTRIVYLEFLERFRMRFGEAIAAIAAAPGGAVLVHCLVGKDRTGLVCALLLRIAGVSRERIAEDYARSGYDLLELNRRWIAEASDVREAQRRERLSAAPAAAMVAVLEELERRYGSAERYLLDAGVSGAQIEQARARLLG